MYNLKTAKPFARKLTFQSDSIILNNIFNKDSFVFFCFFMKQAKTIHTLVLFDFCFYGPSTHFRSFRVQSVILTTLFLGKPPRQFTQYFVHILSPVTENCSSWISGRGRMAAENFFHDHVSTKECAGPGIHTEFDKNYQLLSVTLLPVLLCL